jgi:hypothetical protein
MRRLFEQSDFATYDEEARKQFGQELCRRRGPLIADLRRLTGRSASPEPLKAAANTLLRIGRDPATWSRQLVVLRAVQTLSVLDLRTYCDLVATLGEYDTGAPVENATGLGP